MARGLKGLVGKLTGGSSEREIARLQKLVEHINVLEPEYSALADEQLQTKTVEFRHRLAQGETLDELLVEAFAAVREAAGRTIGMRHYDVQLIGGVILHQGKIVEMKTGEGKTLAATLPLYLNALEGSGVHLVTVNDYLARRDGGWMGPVYEALGMSVGLIIPQFSGLYDFSYVDPTSHLGDERLVHWRPVRRREAYQADITYGTSNEFGFDYLRDNTALDLERCAQRPLHFAIIDEVDNILIDEARTPLIISGPIQRSADKYKLFDTIAARLQRNTAGEDQPPNGEFDLDERTRSVHLTERGIDRVEEHLRQAQEIKTDESIYDPQHFELVHFLENALKARHVFRRDVDYVVNENAEVILVDSRTGRLMPGRRYSEGLHQAIEAKERVHVRSETVTIATVTIQKYFRLYTKLAGMTGTAATEKEEFRHIYDLDVISLPTNVAHLAQLGALTTEKRRLGEIDTVAFAGVEPRYQNTAVTVFRGDDSGRPYFKRVDFADVIYLNEAAKLRAVVEEVKAMQAAGRPVLVGTTSVESSEHLHKTLNRARVKHSVLNAKRHTEEALIIAQAGQPGAVTVATSMAGRGTDIILGGNPEGLAARYVNERCFDLSAVSAIVQLVVNEQSAEAQQLAASGEEKSLGPETLAWAEETQREFARRSEQVAQRGVVPIIVPAVLAAFDTADSLPDRERYAEAVHTLVNFVRRGRLRTAREQASGMGLPPEQTDWIVKWFQDLGAYRRQPVQFLAGELFNRHYNARMALVRAALASEIEEAQRIVTETADLGPELLAGVLDIQNDWAEKRRQVWALGGLHILGTERYEARRIDDQFRGRAARQGDPGTSRFYLSLEDELMRRFAGDTVTGLMERFSVEGDVPLEANVLTRTVESAQRRLEGYYFDMRKHLVEYDEVVSRQRELIYDERHEILSGDLSDLRNRIRSYFEQELNRLASQYLDDPATWLGAEIVSAIADYSNPELDESPVNALGVLRRLRGLIPVLDPSNEAQGATLEAQQLREGLAVIEAADVLQEELELLADQALEDQHHVRLFVRSLAMLVPLQLQVDFTHGGKQRAQWKTVKDHHTIEHEALGFQAPTLVNLDSTASVAECADQYRAQVADYLDALLSEADAPELHPSLEEAMHESIAEVFGRLGALAARSLSKRERTAQLTAARVQLSAGVENVLLELVQSLPQEQVVSTLMGYYDRSLRCWEDHLAHRAMRGFLRRFGIVSPDREDERYLRGPAQVDQELSLAVADFLGEGAEEARSWTDEHWPALWQTVKRACRTDQFQQAAAGPLGEYEAAFAQWLAEQVVKAWETQDGPPINGRREALEQHLVTLLAQARAHLARLELEEFFRWLVLTRMDSEWIQYLEIIDDLRQGIGLQAYAQRDPRVEFRRRAFDMFDQLREEVQRQIVRGFFVELPNYHRFVQRQRELLRTRGELASSDYRMVMSGKGRPKHSRQGRAAGTSVTLVRDVKLGRNDPCWCGSGKKYKHCHMASDLDKQHSRTTTTPPPRTSRGKRGSKRRRR